ncbi:hypothetical protein ebA5953 [Aromatoleum aromaticum EbN1]|uniref:Uncharacterized protein n=1 Tax=Aromatoleum aromaticum (strain DSM 19018 / LMG 30748 / EbN1) TaxID=76114 RepID=Q5NZJ8_AROAE|nr:hypothetical protein ebA5953 [Aromatoleum aromaticum EbN1]
MGGSAAGVSTRPSSLCTYTGYNMFLTSNPIRPAGRCCAAINPVVYLCVMREDSPFARPVTGQGQSGCPFVRADNLMLETRTPRFVLYPQLGIVRK